MLGSIFDAHPHALIAHDYDLFGTVREKADELSKQDTEEIFEDIVKNSILTNKIEKSKKSAGHARHITGQWQGNWHRVVNTVGVSGRASHDFADQKDALDVYNKLKKG